MTESIPPKSHGLTASLMARLPFRSGVLRHSVAWLLVMLVVLIVTAPFVQELENGRYIDAALITLVMTAAVLAVGGRRRTLAVAILLEAPVVLARWIHHYRSDETTFRFFMVTFLIFVGFVIFQFLRFILRSPRVNSEVLCAAVSVYFLYWVSFTLTLIT